MPQRNDITKSRVLRAINSHNPKDGYITYSDVAKELFVDWATAKKHILKYEETKIAFFSMQESALDEAEKAIFLASKTDLSALKYLLSTKGKNRGYGISVTTTQIDSLPVDNKQIGSVKVNILSDEQIDAIERIINNDESSQLYDDFEELDEKGQEKPIKKSV